MNLQTAILLWLFCAVIGAAIANSKNRHWTEGLLLGGLLGVIGVIIELFLRTQAPALPPSGWYPDPDGSGSQRFWNGREWADLPPRPVNSSAPIAPDTSPAVRAPTKNCPDCAETVLAAARVCKHCGHRFIPGPEALMVPRGKTTKVRCHKCQHVQTVPESKSVFACEQCDAKLKRRPT
ncbi:MULTISPECIES: zinc ribbon domain-containing protein [unclassified Mycobacterium]|uniref:zinc ribbon domain-containing protein n=1 Tax=Mycobacterium sp. E188 TaxID=1834130 RepID=UPI0012E8809B